MISTIERICCVGQYLIGIDFYVGNQGIMQSYTLSYLAARNYYKNELKEEMGLDSTLSSVVVDQPQTQVKVKLKPPVQRLFHTNHIPEGFEDWISR